MKSPNKSDEDVRAIAPRLRGVQSPWTLLVLICVLIVSRTETRAATVGADALVIVNSASARYIEFRHHIQPYLDNFGVPYSVLDLKTNAITTNIAHHALIIVGHRQLDTNHVYMDAAAQAILSQTISNGTGLVNFDWALSGSGVSSNYTYAQDIFGFTYSTNSTSSNSITFPATEPGGQLHYITSLHATNEPVTLRSNLVLAGLSFPTNVTALALRGSNPLLMVTTHGQGRAVQWSGYSWMTSAVKGQIAGLDDLMWRSLVWAARKPFVMRGMPNFATLRVDDLSGPTAPTSNTNSFTNWIGMTIEAGFKPYISVFFNCIDSTEAAYLRRITTNGQATVSIHAHGDCSSGGEFFYMNHSTLAPWSDSVMAQKYGQGTAWHTTNGIPISKVVTPHYSEIGTNAFQGLRNWGVEYLQMETVPGQIEYGANPAPWLVGGPYRLYETPLQGQVPFPFFYANWLTIPNHPEMDGWFFNASTEIRDDAACQELCPDNNVSASIGRGVRQLKRAWDSMVMGQLFTHDYYFYPIPNNPGNTTVISSNNWRAILTGITNGLASYKPRFVTLDHACQYVRATRTAQLTNALFDTVTGNVQLGFGGRADLELEVHVYVSDGNSFSNRPATIPAFTNSVSVSSVAVDVPPLIISQPNGAELSFGTNFTLAVEALGTAPMNYQWRYNGTNLPGATNHTLTLAPVTLASMGNYAAAVGNVAGTNVSSNALITVTLPQTVLNGSIRPRSFALTFNTTPGSNYVVEYTSALPSGSWLTLSNLTAHDSNSVAFDSLLNPVLTPRRFYRVKLAPGSEESVFLQGGVQSPQFLLGFNAITGLNYTVEYSGNLSNWQPLATFTAQFTNMIFPDTIVNSQRYYRVTTPVQ